MPRYLFLRGLCWLNQCDYVFVFLQMMCNSATEKNLSLVKKEFDAMSDRAAIINSETISALE
jgi:hypothetical protein